MRRRSSAFGRRPSTPTIRHPERSEGPGLRLTIIAEEAKSSGRARLPAVPKEIAFRFFRAAAGLGGGAKLRQDISNKSCSIPEASGVVRRFGHSQTWQRHN